jgi:hypothetical protein
MIINAKYLMYLLYTGRDITLGKHAHTNYVLFKCMAHKTSIINKKTVRKLFYVKQFKKHTPYAGLYKKIE